MNKAFRTFFVISLMMAGLSVVVAQFSTAFDGIKNIVEASTAFQARAESCSRPVCTKTSSLPKAIRSGTLP